MAITAALIGAGVAAASAIAGGITSAEAAKRQEQYQAGLDAKNAELHNQKLRYYQNEIAKDYTQRADAQALIKRQRELLNEQYRKARARQIVGGASDASLALQQQAANSAMAQTMEGLAAQGAQYKDSMRRGILGEYDRYNGVQNASEQAYMNLEQARMNNIAQATTNAIQVGGDIIGSGVSSDWSFLKKKPTATGTPTVGQ